MSDAESQRFKGWQRAVWSVGDYPAMAEQYQLAADDLVARLDILPGMRVLDVGTGTGNAALAAAAAGAEVVGLDLAPELFDEAERRGEELGLPVRWREGDAEELPFPDGMFDRALSVFGVMFAPRPEVAASELVRVLRPGGRFGVCNWMASGAVLLVMDALGVATLPPAPGGGSPLRWGDPDGVRALFEGQDVDLAFETGAVHWVFASAEEGVRWIEEVSGPVLAAKVALQRAGRWEAARAHLVEAVSAMRRDDIGGIWIRADYLITLGTRRGEGQSFLGGGW